VRWARWPAALDVDSARRGDEIGDLAKTVTVIRENADQGA
jgi:hypothetical protein